MLSRTAQTLLVAASVAFAAPAFAQDAAAELMADPTQLSTMIQGYVVPGNVMAAARRPSSRWGGTPITLAMEGASLTVNGAPVTTPDLMLGNVTVHIIGGAFLPTEG
jgi:uncharacterized surface protein with fasciclin (FAS1) repeats